MRPKSPVLRYAFRAAKARLDEREEKVTVRSLAVEMGANFKTVQRFLYRDTELAAEIGVELVFTKHGLEEYAAAITGIPVDRRPTTRRIAEVLGLDHSAVARFIKAHPELRALHPRFESESEDDEPEVQIDVDPDPLPAASPPIVSAEPRRWRDIAVNVWSESTGRFVGQNASRAQYLNYWAKGVLKHQMQKQPKPEYLPTPEEVEAMI